MTRILAAVAAIAALPTLAAAQAYGPAEITVYGQRADSYSIVIPIGGKDPAEVRSEIWDAAYFACQRAPLTGNRADFTVESMQTCVNEAQYNANAQYDRILGGQ